MDFSTVLLGTAAITGLYMAWNIGANDVANAMGTSVGSGALTLRAAIVVAAIFEFGGALLVGGSVTETISKGIVDLSALPGDAQGFALGMTCCLLASAIWLHIATYFGWPVSTTHSVVGAVVGFGLVAGGINAVDWVQIGQIVASWVVSPVMGGSMAFLAYRFLQRHVLDTEDPLLAMRAWGPLLVLPIFSTLLLSLLWKGLKPLNLDLAFDTAMLISLGAGILATLVAIPLFRWVTTSVTATTHRARLQQVERSFLVLQVMTACFVAFAHGSNDVANAVGPMAAVYGALTDGVSAKVEVPFFILLLGAVGIVIGLATYGYKVMGTVGEKITELTPSRGFTAEFAAAATIVLASKLGLPVSTTHTLVGAVVGVGFARSVGALNTEVLRNIAASWVITVPFTAALASLLFLVTRSLL